MIDKGGALWYILDIKLIDEIPSSILTDEENPRKQERLPVRGSSFTLAERLNQLSWSELPLLSTIELVVDVVTNQVNQHAHGYST